MATMLLQAKVEIWVPLVLHTIRVHACSLICRRAADGHAAANGNGHHSNGLDSPLAVGGAVSSAADAIPAVPSKVLHL
jgi:hypothetical protein